MKRTKKLVSLLLTLVMVLSMSITAFAAQETNADNNGKITINNAVNGKEYSIYQIMELESYSKGKAYSYKATEKWKEWLCTQSDYVSFNEGYASWKENADQAEFAKAALTYAKTLTEGNPTIKADKTAQASNDAVIFDDLSLGYYLVDSPLGALCFLGTTDTTMEIREKHTVPTIGKKVQEDSNNEWGDSNTAQIGDTVNFKVTIKAYPGAENYVLHDKMAAGLTLKSDTIKVTATPKDGEGSDLTSSQDYTVVTGDAVSGDKCTFEIEFTDTYLKTIGQETDIAVTYSAVLNGNAVISTETNNNTAKLTYGDDNTTAEDATATTTFQFDIVKTDKDNKLLSGAKFELYDAKKGGKKINLVKDKDGTYRVAIEGESDFAVIEAGKATVKGLDANTTYWLEETAAPAGYNKLSSRVEVTMESANRTTTMTGDTWVEDNGGVHIINNTGTELPSTGGIGTTIFYVAGSVLVLAAVVLLVTRKRMSEEA